MHTYTPADSIFDGPITNLLSTLCVLIEICSPAHAKEKISLNDFKLGTFIGHFPSDGTASTAMKGLIPELWRCVTGRLSVVLPAFAQ